MCEALNQLADVLSQTCHHAMCSVFDVLMCTIQYADRDDPTPTQMHDLATAALGPGFPGSQDLPQGKEAPEVLCSPTPVPVIGHLVLASLGSQVLNELT